MGLCKCPKKKVTNLFCFEHRVNVCEHCLVESHNKCVVQSYLSWLADSDYDTNCTLCSTPLECKETVRLKCLHLLHWECLDEWARRLPPNTAPAGYKCQQCHEGIFPSPNQTSPAIDRLRVMLQRANWARAGLGLSLLPELDNSPSVASFIPSITNPIMGDLNGQARLHEMNFSTGNGTLTAMVVDVVDEFTKHEEQNQFIARKLMSTNENDYMDTSPLLRSQDRDEDLPENKYKRRSASEWLSRWFRLRYGGRSVFDSRAQWKRGIFCVILSVVLVLTVFTVLLRVSIRSTDDDPVFSPLDNPNIRIALPEHSQ